MSNTTDVAVISPANVGSKNGIVTLFIEHVNNEAIGLWCDMEFNISVTVRHIKQHKTVLYWKFIKIFWVHLKILKITY